MTTNDPVKMTDCELLSATARAVHEERRATAELLALLAEVDVRRLYLGEGYSSMFVYCTRKLHLSEHAAYSRIETARVVRRTPGLLERLSDGRLSLTTVCLLGPHLTEENREALLDAAQHQSKREVERLIAKLHPQPDIPASIRALPVRTPMLSTELDTAVPANAGALAPPVMHESVRPVATGREPMTPLAVPHRAIVAALRPGRYLLRVTIGEATQRKLERARDLLRHELPNGDPAALIDRALTLLVAQAERTKFGAIRTKPITASAEHRHSLASKNSKAAPKRRPRWIPAAVRRAVWARDDGRCAFTGSDGRCGATGFIEFHHVVPFSVGGQSTIENLELRCREHNVYEAERAGLKLWRAPATRSGPS